MKRRICRLEFLSLFEKDTICARLEAMAERGWLPEHIFGPLWIYEKCSPRKRRFDGIRKCFAADAARKMQQMEELFEAGGWHHLTDIGNLCLFWTEDEDAVPLETDALTEVNGLYRTAAKAYIPFFAVSIFILLLFPAWFRMMTADPVTYLARGFPLFMAAWVLLFWLLCLAAVCRVRIWYRKAKRQAQEEGSFLPLRTRTLRMILLVLAAGLDCLVFFAWGRNCLFSDSRRQLLSALFFSLLIAAAGSLLYCRFHDREYLGRETAGRLMKQRMVRTVLCLAVLVVAAAAGSLSEAGNGTAPLLTMKDYGDDAVYALSARNEASILLETENVSIADQDRQGAGMDLYKVLIRYERAEVKWDVLTDYCWQKFLARQADRHPLSEEERRGTWRREDPAVCGTDEAYRLYSAGGRRQNVWIMRKGNIMFDLEFGWTPDEEQLQTAVSRLLDSKWS